MCFSFIKLNHTGLEARKITEAIRFYTIPTIVRSVVCLYVVQSMYVPVYIIYVYNIYIYIHTYVFCVSFT